MPKINAIAETERMPALSQPRMQNDSTQIEEETDLPWRAEEGRILASCNTRDREIQLRLLLPHPPH